MNATYRPVLLNALLLFWLLACPLSGRAADILVNQLADVVDADLSDGVCDIDLVTAGEQCTLRAAVQTAGSGALPGLDRIILQPGGIYQLILTGNDELGDLDLNQDVEIVGYTSDAPTMVSDLPLIDASALGDRIFQVFASANATFRGLRLRAGDSGGGGGGAIWVYGSATIDHCVFDYNDGSIGGAVYFADNSSASQIIDSHFERNQAVSGGAVYLGFPSSVLIQRSSFLDNRTSSVQGATINMVDGALLTIEDSTIDGEELSPPVINYSNRRGIFAAGPQNLVLRNVSIQGFTEVGLDMGAPAPGVMTPAYVRVANSVLHGQAFGCRWQGATGQNVMIAYSQVVGEDGCDGYMANSNGAVPDIGDLEQDPGRYTWSRVPKAPVANVVDRGIPADRPAPGPEMACTDTDQRGNPRPVDGNGDDLARCDVGAVELPVPTTFEVNISSDAVDDVPGDGICDTGAIIIGVPVPCSLRAAVMEANALAGMQRISFADGLGDIMLNLPASPTASGGDLDIGEDIIIHGRLMNGLPQTHIAQTVAGERIFDFSLGAEQIVMMRNLQLSGGDSGPAFGGAIRMIDGQIFMQRSELHDNQSPNAGGAVAVQGGLFFVEDSDFHDNQCNGRGAAVFVSAGAQALLLRGSLHGNTGVDGAGPVAAFEGEGGSTIGVIASTIAGNAAGVAIENPLYAAVASSTVVDSDGAGIEAILAAGQGLYLAASIVHGNGGVSGSDCSFPGGKQDTQGAYVLDGDGTCLLGASTSFTADPMLEPLAATPGHPGMARRPVFDTAAGQYSPALDVADLHSCEFGDQLGIMSPIDLAEVADVDGPCDLGAIERQSSTIFADGLED
ncbi:MAG: right-handed parallel beta-helix repeat-containing protein [Lysobacteraceae bacterium]